MKINLQHFAVTRRLLVNVSFLEIDLLARNFRVSPQCKEEKHIEITAV